MPTYQYRCPECEHEFEEFQSITDDAIETCPACKGKTHRVISGGAGFLFKGTGFYITDYRGSQYKADAAKDKKPTATKSSDSKSDSKASGKKKDSTG